MKKFIAVSVLVALVFVTTSSLFAQGVNEKTGQNAFTPEQRETAKNQLKQLGVLFGVPESNHETNQPPPSANHKTKVDMADVADKALTMVGNAVGTISGIVQKVAPEVWEIMVRQQYASAVSQLVGPLSSLFCTCLITIICKRGWKKGVKYDSESYFTDDPNELGHFTNKGWRAFFTSLVPSILSAVFLLVFSYRIGDVISMMINPKYYAVRDLLSMLLR